MMTLYSGTTCPFSQRCRIVLYEKGMDFQIVDVDLFNKPEDLAVMNPYNQVPVLVERDLILYESNIINEYIDDRFPHPQLMPADPVMRARARLFLFRFEQEMFSHIESIEKGTQKQADKGRTLIRDNLTQIAPGVHQAEAHARRRVLDARRRDRAAPVAARLLRHPAAEAGARRSRSTPSACSAVPRSSTRSPRRESHAKIGRLAMAEKSTKPYLIRAIHEWCSDSNFTPYLSVKVDANTRVPMEYVKNGEIVLNVSYDATHRLTIGNDVDPVLRALQRRLARVLDPDRGRARHLRARERPGPVLPREPAQRQPPRRAAPGDRRRSRRPAQAADRQVSRGTRRLGRSSSRGRNVPPAGSDVRTPCACDRTRPECRRHAQQSARARDGRQARPASSHCQGGHHAYRQKN